MEQHHQEATNILVTDQDHNASATEGRGNETLPEAIPADTGDLVAELKALLAQAKDIGASPDSMQRASMLADTLYERLTYALSATKHSRTLRPRRTDTHSAGSAWTLGCFEAGLVLHAVELSSHPDSHPSH